MQANHHQLDRLPRQAFFRWLAVWRLCGPSVLCFASAYPPMVAPMHRGSAMKQRTCVHRTRQRRRSGLPAGSAPTPRKVHAVDLFCGIGGLTHGLRSSGMTVSAGYDIDPSCRYAYEANNESTFVEADIRDVRFGDIESHYANAAVSVLAGCAPCQPFSAHTRGSKRSNEDCSLLLEFARLVAEGKPEIISIENVPGLARHTAFTEFTDALDSLGYHIDYGVVSCEDYGVPQTRRRLVLLASLLGEIFPARHRHRAPHGGRLHRRSTID